MEKALCLTPPEAAALGASSFEGWDRVYLGSSFCLNLLPTAGDVSRLRRAWQGPLTLATPLLTGAALESFLAELRRLLKMEKTVEVSVNDLGLLDALKRNFRGRAAPLLGRPVSHDLMRMEPSFLAAFMKAHSARLLETDEEAMLPNLPSRAHFGISFHYPGRYLAMSRLCPTSGVLAGPCARPCASGPALIRRPGGADLLVSGNAYFTPNRPAASPLVRRLVFSPACAAPAAKR